MTLIAGREMTWAERRAVVLHQAGYICAECGQEATEADHIWPRKHGGTDDLDNLQALCRKCNATKGDLLLIEHMTSDRLTAAAVVALVAAIDQAFAAARYTSIRQRLDIGDDPRTAHDVVGTVQREFPLSFRAWVAAYLAQQLVPEIDADLITDAVAATEDS